MANKVKQERITSDEATLLVYMKHPTPGRVKTRLAATTGPVRAAELYREWIGQILAQLKPLRPSLSIIGAIDGAPTDAFAAWDSLVDGWWQQPDGDLGTRLDLGFRWAHTFGKPVLALGSDCLEVEPALVSEALQILNSHDVVLGPSGDGGYYLIGTARPLEGLFQGIRWSSEHTLSDQLQVCRTSGWSFSLLPTRDDIDTWADWAAYCQRHRLST